MGANWGLAALSGALGGLAGLPKGMIEAEKFAQTQQELDERKRHAQSMEALQAQVFGLKQQEALDAQTQLANARAAAPEKARPFLGVPGGPELFKHLYPTAAKEPNLIPTDKPIYDPNTQQWIQPPAAATPTPPTGMVPKRTTIGGVTYETPGEPNQGQRREERIHNYLVNVKGLKPGSPQYQEGFLVLEQSAVPVEGIGPFAKVDLLGGGGAKQPPAAAGAPASTATPPGPQPRISEIGRAHV